MTGCHIRRRGTEQLLLCDKVWYRTGVRMCSQQRKTHHMHVTQVHNLSAARMSTEHFST